MPAAQKRKKVTPSRSRVRAASAKLRAKAKPRTKPKSTLTAEQEKAYREFEHAVGLVYKKDYEKAIGEFKVLVQKRPEDRDLLDRVRVYLSVCESRGQRTTRRDAGDPYMQALVQYNEGEYGEALRLLDKVPRGGTAASRVVYLSACAHLAQGDREEGLKLLRDAIQLDADNRYRALNDPDLEEIRTDDDFLDSLGDDEIGA